MHMDPVMPQAVGAILSILVTGFILRLLRQPHVVAYLLAGVVIGPWGLSLVSDSALIGRLGALGVVLLLFFVGMETDPRKLIAHWKTSIFGTLLQILLSIAAVWLVGYFYGWTTVRILLFGFVISLSSTAIVIKLLQEKGLLNSRIGQSVLGITLAQDLAVIPMLVILGMLGSDELDTAHLAKQAVGTIAAGLLFVLIFKRDKIVLPLSKIIKEDKELQLFAALTICFGLAFMSAWFDLSTALGAFIAGMLVGSAKETEWVHQTLDSFKVLFVAVFFVSVGMLLDVDFLIKHWVLAGMLLLAVLITNTFVNALVLRMASYKWKESIFAGLLLSQIGEFSFVLTAVGYQSSIINNFGYQLSLCVISLSLLVSPLWINAGEKLLNIRKS